MDLRGFAGITPPLLWGMAAFLLHYIPFVGATGGIVAMTLVSLIHFDSAWTPFATSGLCLLCDDRGQPSDTFVSRALVNPEPNRHPADFSSLVLPQHVAGTLLSVPLLNLSPSPFHPNRALESVTPRVGKQK